MPRYQPPGTYVEELPTPPPIMALAGDVTAFVGHSATGPVGAPTTVFNVTAFEQSFGALDWPGGHLPRAVELFFANGGRHAIILRAAPETPLSAEALGGTLLPALEGQAVNLLCLPPPLPDDGLPAGALAAAQAWCEPRHVLLLIDPPPDWHDTAAALAGEPGLAPRSAASAVYFPRLRMAQGTTVPCGAVAGVIARTHATRGVWRSPAGGEAELRAVSGLTLDLRRQEQERLTPGRINALRLLRDQYLVWGARTRSADSERKYIAMVRLAWLIEDSLRQGLAWTAAARNEAPTWALVRERAEGFLRRLHRDGGLAGASEREAYVVRCGADTMTAADGAAGRLVCEVGVALLRPAEFTVLRLTLAVRPAV